MEKNAQVKIQEMAFMLVAVMLFFILVGLFAAVLLFDSINKKAEEVALRKTYTSITNLAESPEFSCTLSKTNCVDADKVIFLQNRSKTYMNYFPYSSLRIIRFDAFNLKEEDMKTCNFENYPDCDVIIIYDKKVRYETFMPSYIILCQKIK